MKNAKSRFGKRNNCRIEKNKKPRRVPAQHDRASIHQRYPRPNGSIEIIQFNSEPELENLAQSTAASDLENTSTIDNVSLLDSLSSTEVFQEESIQETDQEEAQTFFGKWKIPLFILGLISLVGIGIAWILGMGGLKSFTEKTDSSTAFQTEQSSSEEVKPVAKSQEAKELVMQEDLAYMDSLYLYYDYPNLSLEDTVKAYLTEQGLDPSQVAFTYKNLKTNEVFSMNDTQLMTAGSTYKLPLNMLVVDAIEKGEVSATESYDITATTYENQAERDAYVANYNGQMTIADMQYGSIVVSENTPAYALAERIGGMDQAYAQFERYGISKNKEVPTISLDGNKTTTSYYTHVLDYLYKHQDKYVDLLGYLDQAFTGQWLEEYVHGVTIYQKPGFVREALNIDAIVMEETPYSIALYTSHFGGASEDDVEIDAMGYNQLVALTYVINEWHRVNMNPAKDVTTTGTATETTTEQNDGN